MSKLGNVPRRYARYAEIMFYEDASGWQTFKYGKLGELTENIRTFALPFENQTYTFKMQYEYDSWNRIQTMTYPDGEVVHYDYNRGGMLKKVYGTVKGDFLPQYPSTPHDSLVPLNPHGLGGQASLNSLPPVGDPVPLYDTHTYLYIDSIAYNEFELKSDVFYGNGTHALYAYDSLLRLLLLQSQTRTGDIMQDIVYTYDSVGNITSISNGAGMLPNGLGGTYNSAYTYDDLYRLTSSTGGWQGSQNISYRTTTLYRGNGRIKQKNLAARKLLNGVSDSVNYSHYYHYENTSQPNTLTRYRSSVWDPGSWLGISNEEDSQFGWDAAGNMTESCIGGDRNCRSLCWDEQNRLQGVKDKRWLSYYQYDAAGDRTYKLTGKGELQNINGEWRYFYHLDNATLYVSPYLVATKQGYTKHYYAETERIASRIGGGRLRYLDQPVVGQGKIVEKQSTNKTYAKEVLEECLDAIHSEGQADLHHLYDMINNAHSETDCYWYHPDHLGSSSWITDSAGTAVQHLHYLPWGEDFVDQRSTNWNAMYTFSAKEKDTETGYSYFGSRYYSSDLSVWLSVDPMASKYPSLSPYVYCADNPVRLVDPNGEEIGNPPLHHHFLITIGIQIYEAAKKKGATPNGAILVLAHACRESGWGKTAKKNGDYNLFGIMGKPSKIPTQHGSLKDYSNIGGYEASINDYFNRTDDKWPTWKDVLAQDCFTSDDIDRALNTGSYFPSKDDQKNGIYAYCGDRDANGKSHYGEGLMEQFVSSKKRFIQSLEYQINKNEEMIRQGIPYSTQYLNILEKDNERYNTILNEIR